MPKFIDDPVGAILGGLGLGLSDEAGQKLAQSGLFGMGPVLAAKDQAKKKGGVVSASKRADGIAQRGKTRGKMV